MSKHQKVLAKLNRQPAAADLSWDELRTVLEHLGYVMRNGTGSRRKFYHAAKDALIICHQPHAAAHVDRGCVADIRAHLKAYGFL